MLLLEAIKKSLQQINHRYCELSRIDYSLDGSSIETAYIENEKYLERPFAYEFYHQFRKLIDNCEVDFGDLVIQGEVDKRYQHIKDLGKIPDFILHVPNSKNDNLAVIEFKHAARPDLKKELKKDFDKLVKFGCAPELRYEYLIEVVIGSSTHIERAMKEVNNLNKSEGIGIVVIIYDIDGYRTKVERICYQTD